MPLYDAWINVTASVSNAALINAALELIYSTDEGAYLINRTYNIFYDLSIVDNSAGEITYVHDYPSPPFHTISIDIAELSTRRYQGVDNQKYSYSLIGALVHELVHATHIYFGVANDPLLYKEERATAFTNEFMAKYFAEVRRGDYNSSDSLGGALQSSVFDASGYQDYAYEGVIGNSMTDLLSIPYEKIARGTEKNDNITLLYEQEGRAIFGYYGDDTVETGVGSDVFDGGDGIDTLTYATRSKIDFLVINEAESAVGVSPWQIGWESDYIINVEKIILTDGDDVVDIKLIASNSALQEIHAGDGDDELYVRGSFTPQQLSVYLGDGDDTLAAGSSNAIIYGEGGDNVFRLGDNILIADADENDRFEYIGMTLSGGVRSKGSEWLCA